MMNSKENSERTKNFALNKGAFKETIFIHYGWTSHQIYQQNVFVEEIFLWIMLLVVHLAQYVTMIFVILQ